MTESRVPAGVPTGGQFTTQPRAAAALTLGAPRRTVTVTGPGGRPRNIDVDIDALMDLGAGPRNALAAVTDHPDVVNRLAADVLATGETEFGGHRAFTDHIETTARLAANPTLDDDHFESFLDAHAIEHRRIDGATIHPVAAGLVSNLNGRSTHLVSKMCAIDSPALGYHLARHVGLRDDHAATLAAPRTNDPAWDNMHAELARDPDGLTDVRVLHHLGDHPLPRVSVAARAALARR